MKRPSKKLEAQPVKSILEKILKIITAAAVIVVKNIKIIETKKNFIAILSEKSESDIKP